MTPARPVQGPRTTLAPPVNGPVTGRARDRATAPQARSQASGASARRLREPAKTPASRAHARAGITLDAWPHPLTSEGRETRRVSIRPGETLAGLAGAEARRLGLDPALVAVELNGTPVPRAARDATPLRLGDIVTLRLIPAGGGDSDPLRAILTLAVVVAAVWAGPAVGGFISEALGLGLTTAQATALGSSVIMVGGTLLVNALVPPAAPEIPPRASLARPDPVHSISGGRNPQRPCQPFLLVLGEHRIFPDLGSRPYTEYVSGADAVADQILRQIFHFGIGEIEIAGADLRIGDTPVADYEHLTLAPPADARGALAWPGDGGTPKAAEDLGADEGWVTRTTGDDTYRVGIDIAGALYGFDRQGRPERRTADIAIEARRAGGGGAWTRLGAETLGHDDTAPFRRGAAWDLAGEGTWEVRVRRTSAPADDDRSGDELTWAALRSYQTDAADYTGQRRLGLSIRASGQLSGPVDRLSALVRQKAPRWRGRAWSAAPAAYSSSPAAVMLLYLRGIRVQGRVVAGAGLPDDRIDLAGLGAWHDWCAAHDPALRCDLALDRTIGHARVIETIARCGRASPTWQSGRLGVVWDAADRPATAMITPGNIVAGSLEVDWAAGRGADEIACRYLEPGLDWQWNTVRRTVPGADDPPASTATLTLAGVTTREHAAMECNLQAARQRYHRRRIAWETGPEGLSIRRADVVHLSHGLLDGGRTGRLVALHDDGCTLDRAVRIAGEAATDWLMLRRPDGAPETVRAHAGPPASDARANGADTARVWTAPAPERGVGEPVDTLWRLYPAGAGPAKVKVVGVSPRAGDRVRIEAIDELGAYYAAATADLSVELPQIRRNLPRVLHATVSETLIRVGAAFLVEIALSLTVAGDWRGAEVRASWERRPMRTVASLDGGDTEARWTSPPEGWIEIVVLPRGGGPPHRIAYTVRGLRTPPGAVTEARVERLGDGTRRFRWAGPADPDLLGVRIRYGPAPAYPADPGTPWEELRAIHRGWLTASPWEAVEPPAGDWLFSFRALDTGGRYGPESRVTARLGAQRRGESLFWACPSAEGWTRGTLAGAALDFSWADPATGAADYAWSELASWDAWTGWALPGAAWAARPTVYTSMPADLGQEGVVSVLAWDSDAAVRPTVRVRAADFRDDLASAAWTGYAAGDRITGRIVQVEWTWTWERGQLPTVRYLCFGLARAHIAAPAG